MARQPFKSGTHRTAARSDPPPAGQPERKRKARAARPEWPGDLHNPQHRAALSLECWAYAGQAYWLRFAWQDCQKAGVLWDELCITVLGRTVAPPEIE